MGGAGNSSAYLKSLNMPYKKREAVRIDGDNLKMIDRIMQTSSAIPNKKFEDDYSKHLNFKKQIMKANPIPVEKILMKKQKQYEGVQQHILPPITSSERTRREKLKNSTSPHPKKRGAGDAKSLSLEKKSTDLEQQPNGFVAGLVQT